MSIRKVFHMRVLTVTWAGGRFQVVDSGSKLSQSNSCVRTHVIHHQATSLCSISHNEIKCLQRSLRLCTYKRYFETGGLEADLIASEMPRLPRHK
jgi:hypothetical protein